MRLLVLLACVPLAVCAAGKPVSPPAIDHHQHFLHAPMAEAGQKPIDARVLVGMLDAAGIRRAVVLSNAFRYGMPDATSADEYQKVIAENDWTGAEATKYPTRLVALCSVNPLKEYAITELRRCARDPRFGRAVKLQFGASNVDFGDPTDIALLRRFFRAANSAGLGLVIHLRTTSRRPYGAAQARIFMDDLLTAAPDVPVQLAHLSGGGGGALDPGAEEMLNEFAAAFLRRDPKVKNLYFDLSGAVGGKNWPARAQLVVNHLRAVGLARVLYGSDGGDPTDPPAKEVVAAYRQLPLSSAEFRIIDTNVAPYLKARAPAKPAR